jgi:hypothetical protein
MSFMPPTGSRVQEHAAARINRQSERQIEASVLYFAEHRDEFDDRLEELDRKWDIERTLEANAASFIAARADARADVRLPLARPADRRGRLCCKTPSRAGVRRSRSSAASAFGPPVRLIRSATP